jgi:hypothetical protein
VKDIRCHEECGMFAATRMSKASSSKIAGSSATGLAYRLVSNGQIGPAESRPTRAEVKEVTMRVLLVILWSL